MMNSRQKAAALYVAVYNRAPDQEGLNFWGGALAAGVPYQEMAKGFVTHPIFNYNYEGLSNQGFVEAVYQNMLGSSGDREGINFWTNALNTGTSMEQFLTSFIEAVFTYTGNDYHAKQRKAEFVNRVKVALDFTERMGEKSNFGADVDLNSLDVLKSPLAAMSYDAIAGVNRYDSSVLSAINKNKQMAGELGWVEPSANYYSNDLTHSVDHKWGTANNDWFYAQLVDGVQTLNSSDVLDAGNGSDSLIISLSGRQWNPTINKIEYHNVTKPVLTGVETLYVVSDAPGQTLDLTDAIGVEQVNLSTRWGGATNNSLDVKGLGNANVKISSIKDNVPIGLYDISGQDFKLDLSYSGQAHRLANVNMHLTEQSTAIKPEAVNINAYGSYARLSGDLSSAKIVNIQYGKDLQFQNLKVDSLAGVNLRDTVTTLKGLNASKWQDLTLHETIVLNLEETGTNLKSIKVVDTYGSYNQEVDLTSSTTSSAIRIDLGRSHNFKFVADVQKSSDTFVLTNKKFNLLEVDNFDVSGAVRDKIDLSAFTIASLNDLNITKYAGDHSHAIISAKSGEFDGRILLTGVLEDGADPVATLANSFIFA